MKMKRTLTCSRSSLIKSSGISNKPIYGDTRAEKVPSKLVRGFVRILLENEDFSINFRHRYLPYTCIAFVCLFFETFFFHFFAVFRIHWRWDFPVDANFGRQISKWMNILGCFTYTLPVKSFIRSNFQYYVI